ncbi:MAG TPA: hypothetical protein VG733_01020 [Chthoniobacteraceae bacterium]|nr:hypothetical protein [Chthoniobacteraceae bacterium]
MMKRLLILFAAFVFLAPAPLGFAASEEFEIPPEKPNQNGFHFETTAKATADGMIEFRIVVTAKQNMEVHATTALGFWKLDKSGVRRASGNDLSQQKDGDSITCVFKVQEKSLDDSDYRFIFTNFDEKIINGKLVRFPDADIYVLKLKDYYKKPGVPAAVAH